MDNLTQAYNLLIEAIPELPKETTIDTIEVIGTLKLIIKRLTIAKYNYRSPSPSLQQEIA